MKYNGNKYRIINRILEYIDKPTRIIEPFCGSCAVSLNYETSSYILNDKNNHLIDLYKSIIENKYFIEFAKEYFTEATNTPETFYKLREIYNTTESIYERSALLIYLNRHTFGGLIRYNSKGLFNAPYNKNKSVYFPEKELLNFRNHFMNKSIFINDSFENIFKFAKPGDLVYCDPPYIQLEQNANFKAYTKIQFTGQDHKNLVSYIEDLSKEGIKVIVSNHDMEETRELYKNAKIIESFNVNRPISAISKSVTKVAPELLAIY